jgi:hypothetical protein
LQPGADLYEDRADPEATYKPKLTGCGFV